MTTVHDDQLGKYAFAREVPIAVTTLDRWKLQGKIAAAVKVGGREFYRRDQIKEARRLKKPPFGK